MNIFTLFTRTSLLSALLLTACQSTSDSTDSTTVQPQSGNASSTIAFALPDRIRTSQAVNLDATTITVTTSAGDVPMRRNGDQFEGSIDVPEGSNFSFTMSISENVGGDSIVYATSNAVINEAIDEDFTVTLNLTDFEYPDDDGDGASNLEEQEAGSNYANSFSTPADPDGMPPPETTPGLVQFATSTYSVTEADGGLMIVVNRTSGSDGRVSVRYELQTETAVLGQDFEASSGELVWPDGDSAPKPIPVVVLADDRNDGEQSFTAHLFSPNGVAIGNGFARITLLDSTPPPQRGTIQLASSRITVDEDAGQVEIEIERVNGSDGEVGVTFSTSTGTASAEDFTGIAEPRTVSWADGENGSRAIRIPITNDDQIEPAETFTVTLSDTSGGATLGVATASVVIADTTPPPLPVPGQIALAQSSYTVAEGDIVTLAIERLDGSDGAASVEYTVATGTADTDDYTSEIGGTVRWLAGDNGPRTFGITTVADDQIEPDETIIVTLQNATGANLGASTTTITITDTTIPPTPIPGTIAFNDAIASVIEGESVALTVARSGGSDGRISADVTAAASVEYTVSPATLVWLDGDSEDKTITLTAVEDDITDDDEDVTISLSNATGDATFSNDSIVVSINDTTEPVPSGPVYVPVPGDGQWEVCIPPFNTPGPSAFATQESASEGRFVSCIKTCDESAIILDQDFAGWGWNPTDLHSCTTARDAVGTYTSVPIYTPNRETVNLALSAALLAAADSIWGCVVETRQNAEFNYVTDQTNTIWYQFLDDGTYFYGSTQDGTQPAELLGPDTWSVTGRVLEIGHLNTGYRNTLFFPGNRTLHIHPSTDNRLSCTRQTRTEPVLLR